MSKPKVPRPKKAVAKDRKPKKRPSKIDRMLMTVPRPESVPFMMMERRDEQQIVSQLQGQFVDEYIYSFMAGGKEVVGLSWLAVQEASRAYGGIEVQLVDGYPKHSPPGEKPERVEVMVKAVDTQTGSSRLGYKCQLKMKESRRGGAIEDPFYMEVAISKAQRNAIRALLPQTLIRSWMLAYKQARRKGQPFTPPPVEQMRDAAKQFDPVEDVLARAAKIMGGRAKAVKWLQDTYKIKRREDMTPEQISNAMDAVLAMEHGRMKI